MNKERREGINSLIGPMEEIVSKLSQFRDEEQEYLDNIPENLQASIRAEESNDAIDTMTHLIGQAEDIKDELEELRGDL